MSKNSESKSVRDPDLPDGSFFLFPKEYVGGLRKEDDGSISSLASLSGNALKIYVLFLAQRNLEKNKKQVFPSYEFISEHTGIKSNETISAALMELAEDGWLEDIQRNGFSSYNKYFVNTRREINNDLIDRLHREKETKSKKIKATKASKKTSSQSESEDQYG